MPMVVSVHGRLVPPAEARVSVFDGGFLYGDSVYETLRAHAGRCFRLSGHLDRLERSAGLVGIELPLGRKGLEAEVARTVEASGEAEATVRVMVTRGEGPIGIDPRSRSRPTLVVIVRPYEALPGWCFERGVTVIVSRTTRNSVRALSPEIKSGNFLNNILAMREAVAAGAFEAVMLNPDGLVAEATQSNVFLVKAGVLSTPDPSAGCLRGITRELVLELAAAAGMTAEERAVHVSELYDADEIFLTSTLKGVLPVSTVGRCRIGDGRPGPVTVRASALLAGEVRRFIEAGEP